MTPPKVLPSLLAVVLCSLIGVPAPAADWALARSDGFVVVCDEGEARARAVAHEFEQVRGLFRELFKARVDAGRPVVVFAVKDAGAMEQLIGQRSNGITPAGMFIQGVEKHFVLFRGDAQEYRSIVYHEFVHLLARLNYKTLPLWVSEGLAEFYATAEIRDDEIRWGFIEGHHVAAVRGVRMTLAELTSATRASSVYNQGHRVGPFYAYSSLLTHYLFFEPKRQGQLRTFLKLLGEDVEQAEALRQAFGDLKALESELWAYSRRISFNGVKVAAKLEPASVTSVKLAVNEADALRGDFLARVGRSSVARPMLERVLAATPENAIAHEAMGILEDREGRRQKAMTHFETAARLAPSSVVAPFRLGILEKPGDPEDRARREASLKTALRVNPLLPNTHAALARLVLEADGRASEAANFAARAAALDPGTVYYRVLLWQAFSKMGEPEKAAKVEAPLRRGAMTDPQTLAELAAELEELGRHAEAEALLKSAQATNPMAADLLEDFYGNRARWDDALVLARAALAKDPALPRNQNLVAYRLAQAGRDLDEALTLISRALKKQPKNPSYLDTKGYVLFRMKRLAEAEMALRDALAIWEYPDILAHLADVLDARGKRTEALQLYDRALEMPDIEPRLRGEIQAKVNAARGVKAL